MKLNILISTLNSGIHQVSNIFLEPQDHVRYTVIHQITSSHYAQPDCIKRSDVQVIQTVGKGLSKSRNLAIDYAQGDIAIIADDDVLYTEQYFNTVLEAYRENPGLDVACFKIRTGEHEPEYKPYYKLPLLIQGDPPHFISSIETTFRISSLQNSNVRFDERFGLGSGQFTSGEEMIFVYDCLKSGLKIKYFPEYIVEHPFESSGKSLSNEKHMTVGAVYARTKGLRSLGIAFKKFASKLPFLFHVKNNPFIYLFFTLKGSMKILLHKKVR